MPSNPKPPVAMTDEQRDMVEHNMDMVYSYVRSRPFLRRNEEDYIQVGMLGLICAVKNFSPNMGYTISTYSRYNIKRAIANFIDANNPIKPPKDFRYRKTREAQEAILDIIKAKSLVREDGTQITPQDYRSAKSQSLAEMRIDVHQEIDRLSPKLGDIIRICCIGGRQMSDVAKDLGTNKSAIRSRRESGFRVLRESLAPYGEAS